MITKIKINSKFGSLGPEFIWENVPKFAVIAGINGAGKTKLLDFLYQDASTAFHNHIDLPASIFPRADLRGKVQYIRINHDFSILHNNSNNSNQIESRNSTIVEHLIENNINNRYEEIEKIRIVIAKQRGINVDDVVKMTREELVNAIPPDAACYIENGFNNQYIAEVFKTYHAKVNAIKVSTYGIKHSTDQEIYDQIGFPPPWDTINDLFKRYENFIYEINKPIEGLLYVPSFNDKSNSDVDNIDFGALSSGEKIIVSLILWAYNHQLGEKNKVFLLDEFDAHLNPSMTKMFIEVVKEKLVKEFGLQVIMTTHSPSTVAHVDDADLFWMERCKNIRKSSKKEIIPILSDGIMTYQEASGFLECIRKSNKKLILFTEGHTDIAHIRTAKEKLGIEDTFEIFHCGERTSGGADKLKQFLIGCPAELFKDKIIVGIFDPDQEGQMKKNFKQCDHSNIYVSKNNPNVYAILLPMPHENFRKYKTGCIEFLYSKEILNSHSILGGKRDLREINRFEEQTTQIGTPDYASMNDVWFYTIKRDNKNKFIEEIKNLEPKEFENFKKLFNLIEAVTKLPSITNEVTQAA